MPPEVEAIQKAFEYLLDNSPYRLYTFMADSPLPHVPQEVAQGLEQAGGVDMIRAVFMQFKEDEFRRCKDNPKRINGYEIIEAFNSLGGRYRSLRQYEKSSGIARKTMTRKKREILAQLAFMAYAQKITPKMTP